MMSLFRYENHNLRNWVKSVFWIGGILLFAMWYSATGVYVHQHYFIDYHTERCAAQIKSSCVELYENEEGSGRLDAASVVWPIGVPITFALRHPGLFALLLPIGTATGFGLYGSYRGLNYWYDERRKFRVVKQEETERKLKEATDYLEKVAPDYAEFLESS